MIKLAVIVGTSRPNGNGHRVGAWVKQIVTADSRFELDYVELDSLNLPFFNEDFSPRYKQYSGKDYTDPAGKAWAERMAGNDAFILITPEYNHGYSAILKNALDWLWHEWSGKAAGFVGYSVSSFGGARAVEQLRQVAAELNLQPVNGAVLIGAVEEAIDQSGAAQKDGTDAALKTLLDELAKLNNKLSA